MDAELVLLLLIGFFAQLVDGALGMAFGVISTSAVMALGMPPASASAMVHTAEIFTTAASGSWHIFHRNVDWRLFVRLGVAGVVGAVLGAWLLSNLDGKLMTPFVAVYLLLMGIYILVRAARLKPQTQFEGRGWPVTTGVAAGFLDASGGGGWGPVATSSLVGAGHEPRLAIGSANTVEFLVAAAAAATFFVELGLSPWQQLVPLVLGALFAAPLGGYVAKRVPARPLMVMVGVLIVSLAAIQLSRTFKLV
jgi:uncharacterized membrane protein YfcA